MHVKQNRYIFYFYMHMVLQTVKKISCTAIRQVSTDCALEPNSVYAPILFLGLRLIVSLVAQGLIDLSVSIHHLLRRVKKKTWAVILTFSWERNLLSGVFWL